MTNWIQYDFRVRTADGSEITSSTTGRSEEEARAVIQKLIDDGQHASHKGAVILGVVRVTDTGQAAPPPPPRTPLIPSTMMAPATKADAKLTTPEPMKQQIVELAEEVQAPQTSMASVVAGLGNAPKPLIFVLALVVAFFIFRKVA